MNPSFQVVSQTDPFEVTSVEELIGIERVVDNREDKPSTRRLGVGLPDFVKKHEFVRADLALDHYLDDDEGLDDEPKKLGPWDEVGVKKANLVTSVVKSTKGKTNEMHRPLLDLDFEVSVLPSSTPGHNHLYIDKEMSKEDLDKLVNVLNEVGLLQNGIKNGWNRRGALSLRLPWIDKNVYEDNKFDYDEYERKRKIQEKIAAAEQTKKDLAAQLAQLSR